MFRIASYSSADGHPLSLESERRKAMSLVFAVERELETFYNKWLKTANDDHVDEWVTYLTAVKGKIGVKQWSSYKEFAFHMEKVKEQSIANANKKIYLELKRVVNRAKAFDAMIVQSRRRLQSALHDHVRKYCLSFCQETACKDILAAQEYENHIGVWTEKVLDGIALLENRFRDYHEFALSNFEEYIQRYGTLLHLMSEVIEVFPKITAPIKDWVTADEAYPRKLLDESNKYLQQKLDITENIRRRHMNSEERKGKVKRSGFNSKLINGKLQHVLTERRVCRKQELAYSDTLGFINDEIEMQKEDLIETLDKLHHKDTTTQKAVDMIMENAESIRQEIKQLEKRAKMITKKMMDIKKGRYEVQKEVHKLKKVYEGSIKVTSRMYDAFDKDERDTRELEEAQRKLIVKVKAAKKIRDVKMNAMTVKMVHAHGYMPGLLQDIDSGGQSFRPQSLDSPKTSIQSFDKWQRLSYRASNKSLDRARESLEKQTMTDNMRRMIIVT
ncbi:hypothetical protein KP79_PYT00537 [Mizuhopecten yessoensis]|uniref:Uncharacterized protein n=2 Tax=Mizuhopecten yessoensis TaxID=6573 RepID=A0A210QWL1_MIZYE|nr:hypothetical protein KP79_PYT00537 [Mizuhopecten yessoensis]